MENSIMAKKHTPKALAAAIGATFFASLAASPVVSAEQNPFAMSPLSSGYQVAGKEGKCGGMKKDGKMKKGMEGQCGEGKCGGMNKDGKMKKGMEGKCGEGKMKKDMKKGKKEGQCGEGKCGGTP